MHNVLRGIKCCSTVFLKEKIFQKESIINDHPAPYEILTESDDNQYFNYRQSSR